MGRELDRWRNRIERLFSKLKNWRRVATRYDKTAESHIGFVSQASGAEPGGRANRRTADRDKAGLSSWNAAGIAHRFGARLAMFGLGPAIKVYLALGATDMRNRVLWSRLAKTLGHQLRRLKQKRPVP